MTLSASNTLLLVVILYKYLFDQGVGLCVQRLLEERSDLVQNLGRILLKTVALLGEVDERPDEVQQTAHGAQLHLHRAGLHLSYDVLGYPEFVKITVWCTAPRQPARTPRKGWPKRSERRRSSSNSPCR